MARGQRRTIEDKIAEKEKVIDSLKLRLKAEQRELEELNREKRDEDLKTLNGVLQEARLSTMEAVDVIKEYMHQRAGSVS